MLSQYVEDMNIRGLWTILFLSFAPLVLRSQSFDTEYRKADSLQRAYSFEEARAAFDSLLKGCSDSSMVDNLQKREVQCENGLSLLRFAGNPEVVAVKTVPARSFFLYYSHLGDSTWMALPNSLVTVPGSTWTNAVYLPKGRGTHIFSAPDESGSWNLNYSVLGADSLWSRPEMIGEEVTSTGNEILPMVSCDGKYLYFSSDGLFGMGGYDLYRCKWNEDTQEWGEPENLGFPFSSPADDFLYSDTPDGKFTIFASNRDCSGDSVRIYVLAFEVLPVKKALTDMEEIRRIAKLRPSVSEPAQNESVTTGHGEIRDTVEAGTAAIRTNDKQYEDYFNALSEHRKVEADISDLEECQKKDRTAYVEVEDETVSKDSLENILLVEENELFSLQQKLSGISSRIQSMETDFLSKGMIVDAENIQPDKKENTVPEKPETSIYTFRKMDMAKKRYFRIRPKKKVFDYSFKTGEKTLIVPVDSIPVGLVYQIHIFNAPANYPIKRLKGLSPVFKRKLANGKCDYSAGIFHSYDEVMQHLNIVKKLGFKDAYVTAFDSGISVSVNVARKREKEQPAATYKVVIRDLKESEQEDARALIMSNSKKDIVRETENNNVTYSVGPFVSKFSADSLANALTAAGIPDVTVEILQ